MEIHAGKLILPLYVLGEMLIHIFMWGNPTPTQTIGWNTIQVFFVDLIIFGMIFRYWDTPIEFKLWRKRK